MKDREQMMIDVFNHFMPKAYLDRLGTLIPGHMVLAAFPRLATLWDIDARLALLDGFDGLQQVRWQNSAPDMATAFRPSWRRCQ